MILFDGNRHPDLPYLTKLFYEPITRSNVMENRLDNVESYYLKRLCSGGWSSLAER